VALRRRAGGPLVVIAVAVAAFTAMMVLTARAPLYSPDAAAYLGVAQNLRSGHGTTVPFDEVADTYSPRDVVGFRGAVPSTVYAPLYPVLITSFAVLTGSSVDQAGRLLGALVAAAIVVLFAAIVRRCLRRGSWFVAAAGAALLGASYWFILAEGYLLSDALLCVWVLATALAMPALLERPTPKRVALVAALAMAAVLTKWAAVAVPIAAAIACLVLTDWAARTRVRTAALVALPGIVAGGAFVLWGRLAGGSSPRPFKVHVPHGLARTAGDVISGWLFGPGFPRTAGAALAIAAAAFVLFAASRARRGGGPVVESAFARTVTLRFAVVFGLVYLAIVLITRFFLDITLPINTPSNLLGVFAASRIYLPLLPLVILFLLVATETAAMRVSGRAATFAVWGVLVVLGGFALVPWFDGRITGSFVRPAFRQSAVLAAVRRVPRPALVVAGAPYDVWLAARRPVVRFPATTVWFTGEKRAEYPADVTELDRLLCARGGVVVAVTPFDLQPFARYAELGPVVTLRDGALYEVTKMRDAPERQCRRVQLDRPR
jgi:hypothetical protein